MKTSIPTGRRRLARDRRQQMAEPCSADRRIPGDLRSQPARPGGGRAWRHPDGHLPAARHAAADERLRTDADRHHAEGHLLIEHVHDSRRIYTDGRDWPKDMEPMFSRLFDRPMARCRRRRPLRHARRRDARAEAAAHLRFYRRSDAHGRQDRGQGTPHHRQVQSEHHSQRDHHHRQRADAPLDHHQELPPRHKSRSPTGGGRRSARRTIRTSSSATRST